LETLNAKLADPAAAARMAALVDDADRAPALPRSLAKLRGSLAARVPAALDRLRDANDDERRRLLEGELDDLLGHKPETYYALILMDGDRMGAWMAGNEDAYRQRFADTWHPQVRNTVGQKFGGDPDIAAYLASLRPASPARHAAISGVLNDYSTHVARHVVEDVFKGKLLYAGGDDVLAMVSVDDLLPAMLLLRAAYSGVGDGVLNGIDLKGLQLGKGFVRLKERLMLMMGSAATASMGAVVAHHQAPLAAVLRLLREAEGRAKGHGRNAFCLRVMKRGGGEVAVTSRFWEKASDPPPLADTALGLMLRFADTLAQPEMSRRAVYHATEWLAGLPPRPKGDDAAWRAMIAANLAFQLQKQGGSPSHASEFVDLACRESTPEHTTQALADLLVTAEFFAREGRAFGPKGAAA
jgi:Predicted hydrolase of the HD superfamily (permuted catalytic motifs)